MNHQITIIPDKYEGSKQVTLKERKQFLGIPYWSHVRTYRGPANHINRVALNWGRIYNVDILDKTQPKLK